MHEEWFYSEIFLPVRHKNIYRSIRLCEWKQNFKLKKNLLPPFLNGILSRGVPLNPADNSTVGRWINLMLVGALTILTWVKGSSFMLVVPSQLWPESRVCHLHPSEHSQGAWLPPFRSLLYQILCASLNTYINTTQFPWIHKQAIIHAWWVVRSGLIVGQIVVWKIKKQ